jgi:hypothetical protein
MRLRILRKHWAGLGLPALALLIGGAAQTNRLIAQKQVTEKEVLPILEKKCFQCHGESLKMANLDLRSLDAMLKGGDKGPALTLGNAAESPLYKRVAGLEQPRMPMTPLPELSASEIAVLESWINQGANWSAMAAEPQAAPIPNNKPAAGYGDYQETVITDQHRQWWAFQKPIRRPPPSVSDARWAGNPIDAFVKTSLEAQGLAAAPEADRGTLIRRLYLDVVGLLPTPAQVDAFVNDPSPRAYEQLVEELLASPHYGERWARYWLDVVRYADSSGFEHDRDLASAWRFRDYVIKAFNEDKPYDRFLIEQIAGDELDEPTYDSLTATAYYRIGPRVRFREKDNPYYRYDYLDDMVRTTFGGFMGLSVHCARCHDHKFDPITRADYYRSLALFFGYVSYDHPLAPKQQVEAWARKTKEVMAKLGPLQKQVAQIEAPYRKAQFEANLNKLPEEAQAAIRTPPDERTPGQKLLAAQFERNLDVDDDNPSAMPEDPALGILTRAATDDTTFIYRGPDASSIDAPPGDGPRPKLNAEDEGKRAALLAEIAALKKEMPEPPVAVEGIRDGDYRLAPEGPGDGPAPGKTYRPEYDDLNTAFLPEPGAGYQVPKVHFGANGLVVEDDNQAPVVEPGFLKVLAKGTERVAHPPARSDYVSSGRRRALAEWIASPDNPLTARVLVNRLWYWHFGRGIVPTPGSFGKMGMAPSHPELLDWLATEFAGQGWSIKKMQRLILTSQTYRSASSFYNAENIEKDPTNVFLWRYPVRRVEAEVIRDMILSASGQINLEAGGPPFFPATPVRVREGYRQGRWELTAEGPATWRRSIYSYWKRGMKFPMFDVHDQPDQNITTEKRNVSTVPTQALTLLNNEFTLLQAQYLADRVSKEAGAAPEEQVRALYRIALSRQPGGNELSTSLEFLSREREFQSAASGSGSGESPERSPELSALTRLAHAMLNLNEFVYIH